MFTWICPKCGAEVPPAYNECPRCTANATVAGQPAPPPAPGPPPPPAAPPPAASHAGTPAQPAYAAPAAPPAAYPPQAYAPQPAYPPPAYPPSPYAAQAYPPARHQAPAWMVSLLTVAGMAAVLGLIYYLVSGRKPAAEPARTIAAAETPQAPVEPKTAAGSSNLTKNLEFTGIRVKEDKQQRVEVHFIAVNHSLAELPAMKLAVKLKTAGRQDALAEFTAELPSMGPFETREITTTAKTKMRAYELPDWQFLQAEVDAKEP